MVSSVAPASARFGGAIIQRRAMLPAVAGADNAMIVVKPRREATVQVITTFWLCADAYYANHTLTNPTEETWSQSYSQRSWHIAKFSWYVLHKALDIVATFCSIVFCTPQAKGN